MDTNFLTNTDFNFGGLSLYPPYCTTFDPRLLITSTPRCERIGGFIFCTIYEFQKMIRKCYRLLYHLPIYTDTDSNRFLGLLTLPIPIFRYEYHTYTDFLKRPISITPIYRSSPNQNRGLKNVFTIKISSSLLSQEVRVKFEILTLPNQLSWNWIRLWLGLVIIISKPLFWPIGTLLSFYHPCV